MSYRTEKPIPTKRRLRIEKTGAITRMIIR